MNQKERMLEGLPYRAGSGELAADSRRCKKLLHQYNLMDAEGWEPRQALLREILGKSGEDPWIEPPFRCDYGIHIEVGDRFYANYNLVVLDVCKVKIGNYVMLGPNVSIYAAGHPLHPDSRRSGYEFGQPITIGDNVWIGGNVVINPGVTIGENCVIGAGSVVTKDIPANSLALGSPCRVLRMITEEDRDFYRSGHRFDVEDYK